jgi:hypothetical protein
VSVIAKTPPQCACTGVSAACSEEGGQEELLMMMSGKTLPAAAGRRSACTGLAALAVEYVKAVSVARVRHID